MSLHSDPRFRDTIAAIATPPGRGGIGVVRISGARVPAMIERIVGRPLVPREASVATFRDDEGEPIDQGLALYFAAPRSYTGEPVLELHGHGGAAVMRALLARCIALGARLARPGEFTERAFLNGKLDLAQAESVADLIDAATTTAARAAARSLSGVFSREVRALVDALIDLRMRVEAALDFPEEDLDFVRADDAQGRLAAIGARLARMLAQASQGALLREGVTVVLVGVPNVGKSSLLNRLAGDDVAIVTPIPGTTRDPIREVIDVLGVPLTIVDTAGLRPTDDPIESLGIERTWAAVGGADLVIAIVDARAVVDAIPEPDREILDRLPPSLPLMVVHNKIDIASPPMKHGVEQREGRPHVFLSAKTGDGVDALRRAILEAAGAHEDVGGTFIARERHLAALRAARSRLDAAAAHLVSAHPPLELFAEELREAQQSLASITGEFTADDLLGVIFSRFCIGK